MVREVLPHVPYVQLVFTIPKMLRKAFLFDRSLHGELSRAAYAATREFLRQHFPELEGTIPAMVVSPQSHGSLLNFHPHLHALSSLGVFDREGRFHPAPDDIDFSPLEELFRERTLRMMLEREVLSEERAGMLRGWRHSGFHVDPSRRLAAEDRSGFEQVLVYMERAPVSLERLEYRREEGLVHYRGNWHPSLGRDHQLLPPPSTSPPSSFPTCSFASSASSAPTGRPLHHRAKEVRVGPEDGAIGLASEPDRRGRRRRGERVRARP